MHNFSQHKTPSLKDFQFLQKLGEGSFSVVYKVKRIQDSQVYALKKVKLNQLKEKERINSLNEVRLLASLEDEHVVAYKEAFIDDDSQSLCIVMELLSGGDVQKKISYATKGGPGFTEKELWKALIHMTSGLQSLHNMKIVHRDLKSANIFLSDDGKFKLGDLNVSKVAKAGLVYTQTGTPYYASPEVWRDEPYDMKSDIWSLGCVLYEMAALKPPFRAHDMESLYRKVQKGQFDPLPNKYSKDLISVINLLLKVKPKERPDCQQILELPAVQAHIDEPLAKSQVNQSKQMELLQTIQIPKNVQALKGKLPKSKYEADNMNKSVGRQSVDKSQEIRYTQLSQKKKDLSPQIKNQRYSPSNRVESTNVQGQHKNDKIMDIQSNKHNYHNYDNYQKQDLSPNQRIESKADVSPNRYNKNYQGQPQRQEYKYDHKQNINKQKDYSPYRIKNEQNQQLKQKDYHSQQTNQTRQNGKSNDVQINTPLYSAQSQNPSLLEHQNRSKSPIENSQQHTHLSSVVQQQNMNKQNINVRASYELPLSSQISPHYEDQIRYPLNPYYSPKIEANNSKVKNGKIENPNQQQKDPHNVFPMGPVKVQKQPRTQPNENQYNREYSNREQIQSIQARPAGKPTRPLSSNLVPDHQLNSKQRALAYNTPQYNIINNIDNQYNHYYPLEKYNRKAPASAQQKQPQRIASDQLIRQPIRANYAVNNNEIQKGKHNSDVPKSYGLQRVPRQQSANIFSHPQIYHQQRLGRY